MSALSDIREAITAKHAGPSVAKVFGSTPRFKVLIGHSAALSVRADTADHRLPMMIDGCPVEQTKQFAGWEVVEL